MNAKETKNNVNVEEKPKRKYRRRGASASLDRNALAAMLSQAARQLRADAKLFARLEKAMG